MASTTKRKPAGRGRKSASTAKAQRPRGRALVVAEPPVQQTLLEAATIGAQALLWLVAVLASVAVLAGAAFGIWSLRPIPAYSSEDVTVGSAFRVAFRVENASEWFPLSNLRIRCALTGLDTPEMPPIEADTSRVPARLEPGQSATFTCPFGPAAGNPAEDDLDAALRSEIYFRSDYDLPVLGAVRLTDNRGPFVLNTRLLPPRWTAKPGRD